MHLVSRALVRQMGAISANEAKIRALHEAVGDPNSLSLNQWVHFHALALEYQPDLIIEFGRGYGNSTCAFVEAVHAYNPSARVFSMCFASCWDQDTLPKLKAFLPEEWFRPLEAPTVDIRTVGFRAVVRDAKRVLVLWDAHGTEIADCVLSRLMPLIAGREHFVVMHDISDGRYCGNSLSYQGKPFWRGQESGWSAETARLRIGWIDTVVEQTFPALDFLTRNELELGSADHVTKTEISRDAALLGRLQQGYPKGFFNDVNHWAFFTLNDAPGPYNFPNYLAAENAAVEPLPPEALSARSPSKAAPYVRPDAAGSGLSLAALSALKRDLERSRICGVRTPLTFLRVAMKLAMNRYKELS